VSVRKEKLSPTALSILVGVGGALVVALGLFLLVLPQRHKAASLKEQIAQTETQIVTARTASTQKTAERVPVTNLFKLAKAMPDHTDMTGIMLQLQKTADEAGVELESIQPGTSASGSGYLVQPINVVVDGKYFTITRFLEQLRKLVTVQGGKLNARGRLFTVTSMHFGPGSRGFPSLGAVLDVNAFVYSGSTGLPPAVAAAPPTTTDATVPSSDAVASGATG
jgi:Tfp pilus assembly protein PilO